MKERIGVVIIDNYHLDRPLKLVSRMLDWLSMTVESSHDDGTHTKYTGVSYRFDECENLSSPPEYEVVASDNMMGGIIFRLFKVTKS